MQLQGTALPTAEEAMRRAWLPHRELAGVQFRLGLQNVQFITAGRWMDLDPSLQRRIRHMDELLEVAVKARKAWIEAVAARQIVQHQQANLEAAQAASDLGQRMVRVGNWSRLQQSTVQLAEASARMALQKARYSASLAQSNLISLLGLRGIETTLLLPDRLPDVPEKAMSEPQLRERAGSVQEHLPDAERMRSKALAPAAAEAYLAAHAIAQDSRNTVLKEREYITRETVLHYNGMLKSVWNLLDETRSQSQATVEAIGAQRDFWIADTDLQWVMQGGVPDRLVSLGGGADAPKAAAH